MYRIFTVVAALIGVLAALAWVRSVPQGGIPHDSYGAPDVQVYASEFSEVLTGLAEFGALLSPDGSSTVWRPAGVDGGGPVRATWWTDSAAAVGQVAVSDGGAFLTWCSRFGGQEMAERFRVEGLDVYRSGTLVYAVRGETGWLSTDYRALRSAFGNEADEEVPVGEGIHGNWRPDASQPLTAWLTALSGESETTLSSAALSFEGERTTDGWHVRVRLPSGGMMENGGQRELPAGLFFPEENLEGALALPLDADSRAALIRLVNGLAEQTGDGVTISSLAALTPLVGSEFSMAGFTAADGSTGYGVALGVTDEELARSWLVRWLGRGEGDGASANAFLGIPLWAEVGDGRMWFASDANWLSAWRERAATSYGEADGRVAAAGGGPHVFARGEVLHRVATPLTYSADESLRLLARLLKRLDQVGINVSPVGDGLAVDIAVTLPAGQTTRSE